MAECWIDTILCLINGHNRGGNLGLILYILHDPFYNKKQKLLPIRTTPFLNDGGQEVNKVHERLKQKKNFSSTITSQYPYRQNDGDPNRQKKIYCIHFPGIQCPSHQVCVKRYAKKTIFTNINVPG